MGIPEDWSKVIDAIPSFLAKENVIGLGEIGLHKGSMLEQDVLREQLKVAREYDVPVIIHTPPQNREEIINKTIEIAVSAGVKPNKIVIDHANVDIINLINDFGAIPGLTIREDGLSSRILLSNLERFQRGVLSSDYSNLKYCDPLSVPKAVKYLELNGVSPEIISNMARRNVKQVLVFRFSCQKIEYIRGLGKLGESPGR